MSSHSELFADHRGLLFSVAYRVLGSVTDAEDAVQDAWIRWAKVALNEVREPKPYLVRVVTNIALNKLRAARAKREEYIGPWLPEPLLTTSDTSDALELNESVSVAMLVVLETLNPEERAVFVLREVFGFPHAEIAEALERSEASVRQLAHRARSHVQARRPRFHTDNAQRARATEKFLNAAFGGDLSELLSTLAPDVTMWADGGGQVRAARNPIAGADKVARFIDGIASRSREDAIPIREMTTRLHQINGSPGVVVYHEEQVIMTLTVDTDESGLINTIHIVRNPEKLKTIPPASDV